MSRHVGTDLPWVSVQQRPTGPSWGLMLSNTTASLSPFAPPSDRFSRCLGTGIVLRVPRICALVLVYSLWCDTLKDDNDGSTLLVAFIGSSFQEAAGGDSNTRR